MTATRSLFLTLTAARAIMTVGLDIKEEHLRGRNPRSRRCAPAVTARDVVDRSTLKTFVIGAADYFQELYAAEGFEALLKTKRVFRDTTGHWRHGPTYLFIIDRTGYTLFHGAFPEKYELQTPTTTLRDAVTGELILPQIIAAATSSEEGGFVEYHFDNPDDDTDSAEILKVTYALERESTACTGAIDPLEIPFRCGAAMVEAFRQAGSFAPASARGAIIRSAG